jgi:hypothetical protein
MRHGNAYEVGIDATTFMVFFFISGSGNVLLTNKVATLITMTSKQPTMVIINCIISKYKDTNTYCVISINCIISIYKDTNIYCLISTRKKNSSTL